MALVEQSFRPEDIGFGPLEETADGQRFQKAGVFLGHTLSGLLIGRPLRPRESGLWLGIDYAFDPKAAREFVFLGLQAPRQVGLTATIIKPGHGEISYIFNRTLQPNGLLFDYSAGFDDGPGRINQLNDMSLIVEAQTSIEP